MTHLYTGIVLVCLLSVFTSLTFADKKKPRDPQRPQVNTKGGDSSLIRVNTGQQWKGIIYQRKRDTGDQILFNQFNMTIFIERREGSIFYGYIELVRIPCLSNNQITEKNKIKGMIEKDVLSFVEYANFREQRVSPVYYELDPQVFSG